MPAEWQTFLQSQGAHIEGEDVLDFGDVKEEKKAALNANVVTALPFLSVIKVTGNDAAGFLHGQFTSDINRLTEAGVQLSAWCNPQGQVITNFIITRFGGEFFLLLPGEVKELFINRLGKFVLRADVTLEDCSDSMPCVGFKHEDVDQITGIEIAERLSSQERAFRNHGLIMLHVPVNWNRVIMFGPVEILEAAWSEIAQSYTRTGSHYWWLFDLLDGLPWILNATTETFLPQMLNMDQMQAVSFTKGCFPGQEIIARLQHRGKVKQCLFILNVENGTPIKPGEKIYASDVEQSVGNIINAATHPDGVIYALAVLDINYVDPEKLYITGQQPRILRITPPQYATLT